MFTLQELSEMLLQSRLQESNCDIKQVKDYTDIVIAEVINKLSPIVELEGMTRKDIARAFRDIKCQLG